jgi:outer membrane lipoprotein carrier protein
MTSYSTFPGGRAVRSLVAALALGLLLGAPGRAAEAQIAGRPSADSAPMTAADSAAMALVERSSATYRSARTLRATFTQTLHNPRSGSTYTAAGEFLQRGAEQFAFRFTDPEGDAIVADGSVLWLYLPSTAKGQVLKVSRAAGAGLDLVDVVLRDPSERFRAEALADTTLSGRAVRPVRLTPRAAGTPFSRATVWVDVGNALIRRAELVELSGMIRTLDFSDMRTGVTFAADAFVFQVPAGVRVIEPGAGR